LLKNINMKKPITVKIGYAIHDSVIPVTQESFESFELANEWSSQIMFENGYDSCEFFHIDGDEAMQEIIDEYLETLE